jgi:SAM-dependent methyltransferase
VYVQEQGGGREGVQGLSGEEKEEMKSLLIGAGNSTERRIGGGEFTDLTVLDLPGADIINLLDAKEIVLHDLNVLPYPFEDDSFDEIHAYEVLEHCGAQGDVEFFFAQFNELHRILREGGHLCASVPLPGSVWAWADPGHRRVITVETLSFLQQEHYEQLGKTTCADYRPWIKGWWQIVWAEPHNDSLYFTLEAL